MVCEWPSYSIPIPTSTARFCGVLLPWDVQPGGLHCKCAPDRPWGVHFTGILRRLVRDAERGEARHATQSVLCEGHGEGSPSGTAGRRGSGMRSERGVHTERGA